MNDCPSPVEVVPRKDGHGPHYRPARHRRHVTTDEEADTGDPIIKCTGKSCKSCTAGFIADCVAICCCPCAVVNILAFAFLKVPWTIGKRVVLKMGKKKKKISKNSELIRKKARIEPKLEPDGGDRCCHGGGSTDTINGGCTTSSFSTTSSDIVFCHEPELKKDEEDLWFELHQVGHLGFGRVSFTGINPSSL